MEASYKRLYEEITLMTEEIFEVANYKFRISHPDESNITIYRRKPLIKILRYICRAKLEKFIDWIILELSESKISGVLENLEELGNIRVKKLNLIFDETRLFNPAKYLSKFSKISEKVTHTIKMYNLHLQEKCLKRMFSCMRHVIVIELGCCRIELTDHADFSKCLEGTHIKVLSFDICGGAQYSNWVNLPIQFQYLTKALSNSELTVSLKRLKLFQSCLDAEFIKQTLRDYGLTDIQFEDRVIVSTRSSNDNIHSTTSS
ncbi:unnamed protein product [Moneuplotes crassus]|uniref:Uncharacterized protein n=1 Tax=Euplotes crassus TaxID=5936 RepID=A0AAD1XS81_EUPCR|nr:unnamed protein product [Moneuplotes crassus]